MGQPVYVVVEKILSGDEDLPYEWPVAGTTGYESLGKMNNLFVEPRGLQSLTSIYSEYIGEETSYYEIAYTQKKRMMEDLFAGETRVLSLHLDSIAERDRHARDLSPEALGNALVEVTASLPVYRTYTRDFRVGTRDRTFIEDAITSARRRAPHIPNACFDFLRRVLLLELRDDEDALRFIMRWQQLTGPVMAKGVEDTTLYRYNRLISMNEVGGSPEPVTPDQFHAFNGVRHQLWPGTLNATSTHDTKRSEDVRARLNVLSEMPAEWRRYVNRWRRWNQLLTGSDWARLDPNQEYHLYQTLAGVWPLDDAITPELIERVKNYMRKAAREAKAQTSWLRQDAEYEAQMLAFVDAILTESEDNLFLPHFRKFQKRVAFYGAINSLAQCVLKIACPGVPDFYQGTTLWDFSLVDPDNRRPAQIAPRQELLEKFESWHCCTAPERIEELLRDWKTGFVKAFVIFKALQFRRRHADLFEKSDYVGLAGTALAQEHVISFARHRGAGWLIAVVPRFLTGRSAREKWPVGRRFWKDGAVLVPEAAPRKYTNVFTGETVTGESQLGMADVLSQFPVALLTGESSVESNSG